MANLTLNTSELTIEQRINRLEVEPNLEIFQDYIDKMNVGDYSLSYSSISAFQHSPLHFLRYKVGDKTTTAAIEFGSLLHTLILEPRNFWKKYIILTKAKGFEEFNWNKGENKDQKTLFQAIAQQENKSIVTEEDLFKALILKESILANSVAGELIRNCHSFEKPISWEFLGINFKGFIDALSHNYMIDLKQVPDADPQKIKWAMKQRKWHWQAFLYFNATNFSPDNFFYNICYDQAGNVTVIRQSYFDLEMARAEITETIEKLQDCIIGENWFYSYEFNTEMGYYTSDELY